jgi:hypothetical protein
VPIPTPLHEAAGPHCGCIGDSNGEATAGNRRDIQDGVEPLDRQTSRTPNPASISATLRSLQALPSGSSPPPRGSA